MNTAIDKQIMEALRELGVQSPSELNITSPTVNVHGIPMPRPAWEYFRAITGRDPVLPPLPQWALNTKVSFDIKDCWEAIVTDYRFGMFVFLPNPYLDNVRPMLYRGEGLLKMCVILDKHVEKFPIEPPTQDHRERALVKSMNKAQRELKKKSKRI